jgi:putative intracellular protease/amidase
MKLHGAEVKVVGAGGARSYTSKHGYPVSVDVQAEQVTAVEFDAVVVPGATRST